MAHNPNKLFVTYLERLREKCVTRGEGRLVVMYDKALDSLRRYPVPLRSVKEAMALRNIGPRVGADLQACLDKYGGDGQRQTEALRSRQSEEAVVNPKKRGNADEAGVGSPERRPWCPWGNQCFRTSPDHRAKFSHRHHPDQVESNPPMTRTSPRAKKARRNAEVVVVVVDDDGEGSLAESTVPMRKSPQRAPKARKDGVVNRADNAAPPSFVGAGKNPPQPKPQAARNVVPSIAKPVSFSNIQNATNKIVHSVVQNSLAHRPVLTARHEVILVVDFRELKRKKGEMMRSALRAAGITFIEKSLSLTDMLWIAQTPNGTDQVVLRHGVERKTVKDLSDSIKDGRYYEQKSRLKVSGLRNVVYLIEGPLTQKKQVFSYQQKRKPDWDNNTLPVETLEAAVLSTSYGGSDFIVERTKDVVATATWLSRYTLRLQAMVASKGLGVEHYFDYGLDEFNSVNKKDSNPTVSQIFGRQLRCISGVSTKKVGGILQVYPTMASLVDAYQGLDRTQSKKLLASLPLPGGTRTLGPKVSEAVARALTRDFAADI